jgi:hypothetical protein
MAPINMAVLADGSWVEDHRNKITAYFRKAPYKAEAFDLFDRFASKACACTTVLDAVLLSISTTSEFLNIPLDVRRSAEMDLAGTHRSARMIRACLLLGSQTLVLGKGSSYLEEDRYLYEAAGVSVEIQDWACPVPNRSILDAVAWHGSDRVRGILSAG